MTRLSALCLLAPLVLSACGGGRATTPPASPSPVVAGPRPLGLQPLAISHVTVVDARSGRLIPDQTVVVAGGRISDVAPAARARVPGDALVVDGSGKYLMPGLWDMHAHLRSRSAPTVEMPLLLAHGVTGVREMASDCRPPARAGDICLGEMRQRQQQVEAGELAGPRLLALGSWIVEGRRAPGDTAPRFFDAATADDARQLARYLAERKVDFIKVYSAIPREGFFALVSEARRLGLPVVGHEPLAASAVELSDAGMRSVEHARVFLFDCWRGAAELRLKGIPQGSGTALYRRMVDEYDPALCDPAFRAFVRNGTWYVPTHLTRRTEAYAADSAMRRDARSKYIPRGKWFAWNADMGRTDASDSSREGRQARMDFYTKGLEITGAAHRAGVRILLGTDAGDSYIFPGWSVHEELSELVRAGLSPAEALVAATWSGAEFLGRTADFGSVERGKVADLLLLDADPLADIRNSRRIAAVVFGGRYLDRAALDALLAGAERAAAGQ